MIHGCKPACHQLSKWARWRVRLEDMSEVSDAARLLPGAPSKQSANAAVKTASIFLLAVAHISWQDVTRYRKGLWELVDGGFGSVKHIFSPFIASHRKNNTALLTWQHQYFIILVWVELRWFNSVSKYSKWSQIVVLGTTGVSAPPSGAWDAQN